MKTGWKAYVGAALVAAFAAANYLGLLTPEQGELFLRLGEALGIVGIRHAVGRQS